MVWEMRGWSLNNAAVALLTVQCGHRILQGSRATQFWPHYIGSPHYLGPHLLRDLDCKWNYYINCSSRASPSAVFCSASYRHSASTMKSKIHNIINVCMYNRPSSPHTPTTILNVPPCFGHFVFLGFDSLCSHKLRREFVWCSSATRKHVKKTVHCFIVSIFRLQIGRLYWDGCTYDMYFRS